MKRLEAMIAAQRKLRQKASSKKAAGFQRFFKTGPGEYGEGDYFIGTSVPQTRSVAREFVHLGEKEIRILLKSKIHEDRLMGLMILVEQYKKTKDLKAKNKIAQFYLKTRQGVNNWDLVDLSAYKILGEHCLLTADDQILYRLSKSKRHWDKRMAMVSSFAFIRKGKVDLTYRLAKSFLGESEDLMHKAVGWMLREAGKRDVVKLKKFIRLNGKKMPRTMLRYSIEKFSSQERKKILIETRVIDRSSK